MSSSRGKRCPLFFIVFLPLIFTGTAEAQFPATSIQEIAQTADLIFVGTVETQESYYDDQETTIFTDVSFTNEEVVHASDQAEQADDATIQLSHMGGTVEDVRLAVSEAPAFETERRYLVFKRDDGQQYVNPLIAGNQGLFQIVEDRETGTAYVLTAGGQALIGADEEGLTTSSRLVDYIENGEVFWESNEQIDRYISTQVPTSEDEDADVTVRHPEESYTSELPVTLDTFVEFIQSTALEAPVQDPVLRMEGQGAWYREEDGETVEEELPGAKEATAGKTSGSPAGKTGSTADPEGVTGQTLQTCGAQNLDIVMEHLNSRKQEHDNAMAVWNKFVDVYRTTADDGTYGDNNGDNEFVGFPSNSDLNSMYGRNWNGDLAVTRTWTRNGCGTITETDVMYNPSYSWSKNLRLIVNNSSIRNFRWTAMHELGHTWGFQNVNEAYNYDHPTVMHGGYATGIMEDGWGIHVPGADLMRRNYSSQTSAESITDIGVEAYYARSGGSRNALQAAVPENGTGSKTTDFYPGQKMTVDRMTIENMSTSSESIDLTFYLSDDRTITSSDRKLATYSWSSIGSAKYFTGDFTMEIPFEMREHTGQYFVGAIVEIPDAQDDFTRNNATRLFDPIDVQRPLTVSGTVEDGAGDPISDVTLRGFGSGITVTTGSNGTYEGPIPYGFSGDIEPEHEFYTFSPSTESISGATSPQTADFTGTRKTAKISGYVTESSSSQAIAGVEMRGLPGNVTTQSTGLYEVTVEQGYDYTVTPRKAGYNFTPVSKTWTEIGEDKTQDFSGEPGGLANSDWPQFRKGERHSGSFGGEPVTSAKTAWNVSTGDMIYSSPAIGPSGSVYVGSDDENLHAYEADGQPKWTFSTEGRIRSAPAVGAGEVIYVGSYDASLYAVEPGGTEKWSYSTGGAIVASPTVGPDGTIYVGSTDENLYAISSTGTENWTFSTNGNILTSPAVGPDSTIYVGSSDNYIYAINPDGTEKWKYQTGDRVTSSPAVDRRGVIYVGSDDNTLYALTPDGQLKWTYSTGGSVSSSPAVGDGGNRIYFGSDDHKLYALDSTGTMQWSYTTGGPVESSPAVHQYEIAGAGYFSGATAEIVYVGSDDNNIYGIQGVGVTPTTPASGTKRWEYPTGGKVSSSPALTDNAVYIGSFSQRLYKLEGRKQADGQVAVHGIDPEMQEKVDVAVALAESGWFEEGGILGGGIPGEDGGCEGGPRIIPSCGQTFGTYGSVSGRIDIVAGEEVRFGVIRDGYLEEVRSGESSEGLLGEFTRTFEEGERFFAVVSGIANPEGYAPNPDGRSTELQLFVKEDYQLAADSREQVRLFAGHFVPDGSTMEIIIEGAGGTFSELRYGDMSKALQLAPERYEVSMVVEGGSVGKTDRTVVERTVELDLRERGGETLALFASGFLRPEENNDGPALQMQTLAADGQTTTLGADGETGTGVEKTASALPERFELGQNYPNPFNPSTTFEYALPKPGPVKLTIYNTMGKKIRELVNRQQAAGQYTVEFDASGLPSGMYIYRLETPNFSKTREMMLVK